MNLEKFVEVSAGFDDVVFASKERVGVIKNRFKENLVKTKRFPANQIHEINLDGSEWLCVHFYVEFLDQVVMAYNLEEVGDGIFVQARRFEKANVAGMALLNIAKNTVKGRPLKGFLGNMGKIAGGVISPSPLNKVAQTMASIEVDLIKRSLHQSITNQS